MARGKNDLIRLIVGLALIVGAGVLIVHRARHGAVEPASPMDPTGDSAAEAADTPYRYRWLDDGVLWAGGSTMGRIPWEVQICPGQIDRDRAEQAAGDCFEALERVNRVMSAYLPDSGVARLNNAAAGQAVALDRELFDLLEVARRHTQLTDGAFDPTARRLFRHWKASGKTDRLPTDAELADLRGQAGWDRLHLNRAGHTATKAVGALEVDLGAIAKGYAVDQIVSAMQAAGVAGGLVEVGGEVRVFGASPRGRHWILGIRHPFEAALGHGSMCGKLKVADRAVATSGNYFRYTKIQGKRYSHIVDPRTGRPVDAVPSVTVIADDCTTADIWATALSVLGPEGLAKIEAIEWREAMMITGNRSAAQAVSTSGFDAYLHGGPIDTKPVRP